MVVDLTLYAAVAWPYPVRFPGIAGTAYCPLHYGESGATSNDSPVRSSLYGLSVGRLVVAVTGGSGELRSQFVVVVASVHSFAVPSTAVSVARSEIMETDQSDFETRHIEPILPNRCRVDS